MALWRDALSWSGPQRAGARPPGGRFERAARTALFGNDDASAAYAAVQGLIGHGVSNDVAFRGQVLAVMRAIDEAFYLVHPRSVVAAPGAGVRAARADWLRDARDTRLMTGAYASDGTHMLLPRGPLLRGERHAGASSADSLADRFAALAVTASTLEQDGRHIKVKVQIVSSSASRGVTPGAAGGAETVAFMPVAEAAGDLVPRERKTAGQAWFEFQPDPGVDASQAILRALAAAGAVDLAIAPEFMVSESCAEGLCAAIPGLDEPPRLFIAGSGPTVATVDDQPWNEARVVNGAGVEIWRQRKLWPAGLDADRAKKFGLTPPEDNALTYEDTAAGDEIIVADIDGLGRCVVLICQDLKAELLAQQMMIQYQPDWVFAPLLDTGVGENRWMHRRAFELSALAQTRFVIASSTSLAAKAGYADPACAMAIGPEAPRPEETREGEIPRAFQVARATTKADGRLAVIQWRRGRWLNTKLKAD